jgi:hypothetical protein
MVHVVSNQNMKEYSSAIKTLKELNVNMKIVL